MKQASHYTIFTLQLIQWGTNNIRLPDRWRHLDSGGLRVRKLWVVCLHNDDIVARCILDNIALWDTRTASAPSIYIVSSVGISLDAHQGGSLYHFYDGLWYDLPGADVNQSVGYFLQMKDNQWEIDCQACHTQLGYCCWIKASSYTDTSRLNVGQVCKINKLIK